MSDEMKRDLLGRLARLGPLPNDAAVTQEQLDEFFDVILLIDLAPPDTDYIQLLLATFGYGDDFGGYVHGANALLRQDRDAVIEAALEALDSGRDGSRQWAMETFRRMQERYHGNPPPSAREVRLAEAALRGPSLVAEAAVWWGYWVDGPVGRRVLELGSNEATGEARALAKELLAG
jgi:hypothetical protein